MLPTPDELAASNAQVTSEDAAFVSESRRTVASILKGSDPRLLIVIGPCSIHNCGEALEYAALLQRERELHPNLFLVMRVYFEKPRTRVGWKVKKILQTLILS